MELLKLAIKYYLNITGFTCKEFYDNLSEIISADIEKQTGDTWLRHKLVEQVIDNGFDLQHILDAESTMYSYFEKKYDSDMQEYSADAVWGKEVFKILANQGIDVDNSVFWNLFCLSDTLFPSKLNAHNVFMSHYSQQVISTQKTKKGTLFVHDFFKSGIDDLPVLLKETIEQDKPLVLLCCIPIKKNNIRTKISDELYKEGFTQQSGNIYYEVLYRFRQFVQQYNLTNTYLGFFGDTSLYTDKDNSRFLNTFRDSFSFKGGFCFSLRDFNSTLLNVKSMHFSLWKTEKGEKAPILLTKLRLLSKTKTEIGEPILFATERSSILDWIQPKDALFYTDAPAMINYGTFKKSEKGEKVAKCSNRVATNSLGTIVLTGKMKGIKQTMLLSSAPSHGDYVDITEENFDRIVPAFAFSCIAIPTWNNDTMTISAPNTEVEGFDKWCKNAILTCFFDKQAQFSNIRNIDWNMTRYNVENKMFFADAEFISMSTQDTLIQQQIHEPYSNEFVIKKIREAQPYWDMATTNLYEFCLDFVRRTLDMRKGERYIEDIDSWNAGFSQLVAVFGEKDLIFKANFNRLYSNYLKYLSEGVSKFGFLQEK